MKKLIGLFICIILLTGCAGGSEGKKKLRIEIYSASDGSLINTVEDSEGANRPADFSDWEPAEGLTEGSEPEYQLLIYQEKTLLYGQDPADEREYELIETVTTFRGSPCVRDIISDSVLTGFTVPDDVLTFYYIMPDEVREKLGEKVGG